MGDPTNRNDPEFSNNPDFVFSGGRWQNRNAGAGVDPNAPAQGGSVKGESLGTPGGWSDIFDGLFSRLGGKPFAGGTTVAPPASIPNAKHWQDVARAGATRQQGVNPYDASVADRSRPAQMALIEQMRAQANGPSLAGMQGQRALGQSGQQAIGAAAMGAPNRAAMLQSQSVGAGLAGDVGQARLGEMMRAQAGMGGVAGNLRGGDLRSAEAQMGAGFKAQEQSDQNSRFYSSLGSGMTTAGNRMGLENFKLLGRIKAQGKAVNKQEAENYMKLIASLAGGSK